MPSVTVATLQCVLTVAPLPVSRAPHWLSRPEGARLIQGERLELRAEAGGLPCPALAWQKVGGHSLTH